MEEDGAQDEARVVHVMKQACGSIVEAHAAGLIHRDLKPANLMLCQRGGLLDFVKVLDFGLVRDEKSELALTRADALTGTPLYLSPEALEAPETIDPRSDLYQLGAVAYFLITGRHVFSGESVVDVLGKHLHSAPDLPSSVLGRPVSPDLERIVLSCLEKDRERRPEERRGAAGGVRELRGRPTLDAGGRAGVVGAVVDPPSRHRGGRLRVFSSLGLPDRPRREERLISQVRFAFVAAIAMIAAARRDRLTAQIEASLPAWSLAPVVLALQAMRGLALVNAATLIAELGDLTRFAEARQLMAFLGLVPSENSSGGAVSRGGITKTGNTAARRVLVEAAWTYRFPARISREQRLRQEALPKPVRDIAWKAQLRLCARYRKLALARKPANVVTTAIARELAGFVWAIARQVSPIR